LHDRGSGSIGGGDDRGFQRPQFLDGVEGFGPIPDESSGERAREGRHTCHGKHDDREEEA
jgi:hypothetical protein